MTELNDKEYFLFIEPNKIKFEALDSSSRVFLTKNNFIENFRDNKDYNQLERFLDSNIFEIEKNLNSYIKNITLVIEHENFLFVNTSMKYHFDGSEFNLNKLNNSLIELKSHFKNTIGNYEIIHMIINKFIVDGKIYSELTEIGNFEKICLEIRFICLNKDLIDDLKNILSKYQILVRHIVSFKYLNEFENITSSKTSITASKILKGLNQNEIFFSSKTPKNTSFFEKFFRFFN